MQTRFLIAIAQNPEIIESVFDWTTLAPSIKWQEIDAIKTNKQDGKLVIDKSLTNMINNQRVRNKIYQVIENWDYSAQELMMNFPTGVYLVSQI